MRHQRAELHRVDLITDEEYAELCGDLNSVNRLHAYDEICNRIRWLEQQREIECKQKEAALNESEIYLKERDRLQRDNEKLREALIMICESSNSIKEATERAKDTLKGR